MGSRGEIAFQNDLVTRLGHMFPGCFIFRGPAADYQGIPDLIIMWESHWAALEAKDSIDSPEQPNQDYYVTRFNEMSFAAFIYPENEEEVLDALQHAFGLGG